MKTFAQRALFEQTRIDWETPQWLFDQLDAEFGFTLDSCATAENLIFREKGDSGRA